MNQSAPILPVSTGEQLKMDGIQRVSENNARWIDRAYDQAVLFVQNRIGIFTADDLRSYLRPLVGGPMHDNAWGALIHKLAGRGLIRRCMSVEKSTRPAAHSRVLAMWEPVKGTKK